MEYILNHQVFQRLLAQVCHCLQMTDWFLPKSFPADLHVSVGRNPDRANE